jgi:hypothetical protein
MLHLDFVVPMVWFFQTNMRWDNNIATQLKIAKASFCTPKSTFTTISEAYGDKKPIKY